MNKQSNLCHKDVIAQQLVEQVRAAFASAGGCAEGLCCFDIRVEGLSVLEWLRMQKTPTRVYWSDRDGQSECAGVGAAHVLSGRDDSDMSNVLSTIEQTISCGRGACKYYGGICFERQDTRNESWGGFAPFCFVVPQFELRCENGVTVFAFNVKCGRQDSAQSVVDRLIWALDGVVFEESAGEAETADTLADASIVGRVDIPDKSQWRSNVERAVADMAENDISKIVLSRKTLVEMSGPVDAVGLLSAIKKHNTNTYDFCFQLDDHDAFIGCSPECLFSRRGNEIYSEAIAGTCPTGTTDGERLYHQGQLTRSAKEVEEHGYVYDDVKADLGKICREISVVDERDIVSLSYVQHFCSRFAGVLNDDVSTCDIIESLHPTAAVNGFPKDAAIAEIRKCETFCRGWYAGPVGWIGKDAAEFAVGIRSARVEGCRISLFAGAGLVSASDSQLEWDETQNKLSLFLDVICGRRQEDP